MHRRPLPLLLFVFLLIGSRSLFADEKSGETSPREYGKPKQLGILTDEAIDESSGIAASRSVPGAYWTHNDSGDSPRIFLISKTGKTLATFQVDGAQAEDWEDICSFVHDSKNYLLIGDVGDNQRRRNEVKLYLVEEPTLEKNAEGVKGSVPVAMTLRVKYEDGPRDCESIAVDPASMKIYLVAKQFSTKCPIYEIPLPEKSPPDPVVAKACGTLPVSIATAMDISPDGRRMIVATYASAYEFTRNPDEDWPAACKRPPRKIAMPSQRQGESICFDASGNSLRLTSEGSEQPFWIVPTRE